MTPVTKDQYFKALSLGVKALLKLDYNMECALHFKAEFGDVAIMLKLGGDIVLGIIIEHKLVALFDYTDDGVGNKYWTKRGEEVLGYWSTREIYECGMKLAELAKEAAK